MIIKLGDIATEFKRGDADTDSASKQGTCKKGECLYSLRDYEEYLSSTPVEPPKHQTHTSTPIEPLKPFRGDSGAFEQDSESNEYRYISAPWLNEVAIGLTAGAKKHPNETWRKIPTEEHIARAIRHLNMYLIGDRSEPHLVNASMRVMMAFETEEDSHADD